MYCFKVSNINGKQRKASLDSKAALELSGHFLRIKWKQ